MGNWQDKGKTPSDDVFDFITLGAGSLLGDTHVVEDKETGATRELWVSPGQSVGEAIADGQWRDKE